MNKTYVIANWKMNPGSAGEAAKLAKEISDNVFVQDLPGMEVVLCPPFAYVETVVGEVAERSDIQLGAQDCFWEQGGAYTGEVSPHMLKDLGCSYVILGHSERKKYLGETEDMVQKKREAALAVGLKVVLCVGENEETPAPAENLIVVYEPEWAISSEGGEAADPSKVAARIAEMRKTLKATPILYGGSTDSKNIKQFIEAGAQGALVGSASLDATEFIRLVKRAAA